jgi:hypothetical protein
VMPVLLFGIDTTSMMLRAQEMLAATKSGKEPPPEPDPTELNRRLQRRP